MSAYHSIDLYDNVCGQLRRNPDHRAGAFRICKDFLEKSIKFKAPKNGMCADVNSSTVLGEFVASYAAPLRLPYKFITIEYESEVRPTSVLAGDLVHDRTVVMAMEVSEEDYMSIPMPPNVHLMHGPAIYISSAVRVKGFKNYPAQWVVMPVVALIHEDGHFAWMTHPGYTITADQYLAGGGDVERDLRDEIWAVVTLIASLACKNVNTSDEVLPRNFRKAAEKSGNDLYAYKVLTLNGEASKSEALGGTHASPRTHLRRGHIRRLPKGNIWVNACMVHGKTPGIVHKDYAVPG